MKQLWCNHSKTIVSLTTGSVLVLFARVVYPDGGVDFDLFTLVGGVLLSFGLQGVIDYFFCETSKPEDP